MYMRTRYFIAGILLLALFAGCSSDSGEGDAPGGGSGDLYGYVRDASGSAIEGVVVSDGYTCTVTGADGRYAMQRHPNAYYVYYSTPADCKVEVDPSTGLPLFYQKIRKSQPQYDFTLTRQAEETKFRMLAIGDPQVTTTAQVYRFETETVADINSYVAAQTDGLPTYAITLGDIVGNKWELYPDMVKAMARSKTSVPVFQTIGNHDHLNEADNSVTSTYWKSVENFQKYFGPQNYSFDRGDVHIVSMDNVLHGEIPDLGEDQEFAAGFYDWQFEWLKRDLSYVPKDKMVILCCHVPFRGGASYCHSDKRYRREVLELLSEYAEAHLMIGHTHYNQNYIHSVNGKTIYEHIQGAACGAFWHASFNGDGTPNGYAVYDIEGAHIADWRFKATGRDEGFQMRVYRGNQTFYHDKQNKGGLDATMKDKYGPYNYGLGADDILVNVWNIEHDGSWTVTLYQRGENIGQMTNYTSSAGRTEKLHDLWAAYWIYQVYGAGFTTTSCQHLYKGTLKYPDEPYEIRAEKTDGSRAPYVCTAPPTTDYDEFKNIKYDFDLVSK